MIKKKSLLILILFLISSLVGCASKTEYPSYEDKKGKGPNLFNKDVEFCKRYAQENEKQIEGSKGAGERFQYKHSIFILCMKNKDWEIKQ